MRRASCRGDRGAAAVEFALVAPVLLLLVIGIISYGYMLSFRQAISQAAAEGARAGAVWSAAYSAGQDAQRVTAAKQRVDEALSSYGVTCATAGVTCDVTIAACGSARCVSVLVSYPYDSRPLTPSFPLVPLPSALSYSAQARVS